MKPVSKLFVLVSFSVQALSGYAQGEKQQLFEAGAPLEISLKVSIREVEDTKQDSIYLPGILYFRQTGGNTDSIKAGLKSRGNFRLNACYFPPLWIKFNKKDIKGTIFEGNKKLKLVLPCYKQKGSNELVVKEYLCYKLFELVSPYYFKTRLVNIDFTEIKRKKEEHFPIAGFLIEDLSATAKRLHAKALERTKLHPVALQDTATVRFALFQYMISNVDMSSVYQHNTKLIQLDRGDYISLPYDFDFSGLVNAPYSFVPEPGGEKLGTEDVRERLYRGFCQSEEVTQFVRRQFLAKKDAILSCADAFKKELSEDDLSEIKDFLQDFFDILSNDSSFRDNITAQCRDAKSI
jgi:hypothetical protein